MSPKRPSSRRVSTASSSKPYSKPPQTEVKLKGGPIAPAQPEITQTRTPTGLPGFPSYAQYKALEASFLDSVSPKRQPRALISQALFDKIWDVLHDTDTLKETAQFRFWVRKMFTLGELTFPEGDPATPSTQSSQSVLLHDGLIVATQEQLYDLLCYAHGTAKHGGRDKTNAALRKYYTWVPKELITLFVKACPTCLLRKCGLAQDSKIGASTGQDLEQSLPTFRDFLHNFASQRGISSENEASWHLTDVPVPGPSRPAEDDRTEILNELNHGFNKTEPAELTLDFFPPKLQRTQTGLQSLPMSREVSLYKGLPNGWQFHTDYATAHAAFVKSMNEPAESANKREKRPRIPSIAPIRPPNLESPDEEKSQESMFRNAPPPMPASEWDEQLRNEALPAEALPDSLDRLEYAAPHAPHEAYSPAQIDPILLALTNDILSATLFASSPYRPVAPSTRSPLRTQPSSTSLRRAGAPPPIDLQSLSSQQTINAFLALREASGITPDSSAPCPAESPTSSVDSFSSHLSAFPMTATSSVSPTNSALVTPLDEVSGCGGNVVGKKPAETIGDINLSSKQGLEIVDATL